MNERLKNKTVLITGASGGLGEMIARQAAANNANLVLLARNYKKLKEIKADIQNAYPVNIQIYKADVGDILQLTEVYKQILKETETIDVLVNNAGFGLFKNVTDTNIYEAEKMFKVNVIGLIAMTKLVLPQMIERGSGHIINIASQAGKISTPKSAVYSATKKAVLGFSDSLRMEVQTSGIFVTTVNPGPIETNFFNVADESGNYLKNVGSWALKPEKVASHIISKMLTNTREINLPKLMNAASKIYSLFPSVVEKLGKNAFNKK